MTPDRSLAYLLSRTTTPLMDCAVWNGTTQRGYGVIQVDRRWKKVHRLVWELKHGPIPDGLVIDHLCRVRSCINTDHMELVTSAENSRRAAPFRVGIRAQSADECPNGHPYTEDSPSRGAGRWRCRICRKENRSRERATQAAASPGG